MALGPPVEAMGFDFYDWQANMQPAEVALRLRVTQAGVWNAVAFWFDLQLDEENQLSTSPYSSNKVWVRVQGQGLGSGFRPSGQGFRSLNSTGSRVKGKGSVYLLVIHHALRPARRLALC